MLVSDGALLAVGPRRRRGSPADGGASPPSSAPCTSSMSLEASDSALERSHLKYWVDLPPPPRRRPTWREYRQTAATAMATATGKRKAIAPTMPQKKRLYQSTLVFASPAQAVARGSGSASQHGHAPLSQPLEGHSAFRDTAGIERLAMPASPSQKDCSKLPVAQSNPLRPYYKHLQSWDYPSDAGQSLFVEPRKSSEFFGDQKWQLTHRITSKADGIVCPWTLKQKTLFVEGESCGRALISVELLLKHIERCHVNTSGGRHFTCRWGACSNRTFASPCLLREHIIERHAPHLGWSCPFQECKLSTSIPRDVWTSGLHIDKAHDELYEPLRPLALPRPVALPVAPMPAAFRTKQPAWALLLPCPQASSGKHSKPPPAQLHQPPAAVAGVIGAVSPILEPGCHPWDVMLPILDDLEPHATPLFGVKPSGQECWIDLQVLPRDEDETLCDPRSIESSNRVKEFSALFSTISLQAGTGAEHAVDVDEELTSGFLTPSLMFKPDPEAEKARIRLALEGPSSHRKEVLVQTEDLTEGLSLASTKTYGHSNLAVASSCGGEGSDPDSNVLIPKNPLGHSTLSPMFHAQTHQSDRDPTECREAGVQFGQSTTISRIAMIMAPLATEGGLPGNAESQTLDQEQGQAVEGASPLSAPATSGAEAKRVNRTQCNLASANEMRSSTTPPPPYTL